MPFADTLSEIAYHVKLASDPEDMIFTMGATWSGTDPPGSTEITAVYDAWADNWLTLLDDSYIFRGLRWTGADFNGEQFDVELFSNAAGTASGVHLPSNCALLVQKRSGIAGRANRGRCYIPGVIPAASASENGTIDNTSLGNRQTAASAWFTDLSAVSGLEPAILHGTLTSTPISALVVDDVIATQRRRLRP